MRSASVSSPLRITQALNADRVGPAVRRKPNTPSMTSALRAQRRRRPAPGPGRRDTWSPNGSRDPRRVASGRCRAGVQKQLSTASSAPARFATAASAAMSATSVSGLDGVSRKNSLVFGPQRRSPCRRARAATRRWFRRRSAPGCCRTAAPSRRRRALEQTTWSPAFSKRHHASPGSPTCRRRWPRRLPRLRAPPAAPATCVTVGLVKRE